MAIWDKYKKIEFAPEAGTYAGQSKDYYCLGDGPPIVILHELPGLSHTTFALSDHLIDAGFSCFIPHMFGEIGVKETIGNAICIRKEFNFLARNKSSPFADWIRHFCKEVKAKSEQNGVGVIGMCLTGNFAYTLMADDAVLASVISQPSMAPPHAIRQTIDNAIDRLDDMNQHMLAFRYQFDPMSTLAKMRIIEAMFNRPEGKPERERVKVNPCGKIPGLGHSVLTSEHVASPDFDIRNPLHPTQKALMETITYFRDSFARLGVNP